MWVKTNANGFVNMDNVTHLTVSSSGYRIVANLIGGSTVELSPIYSSVEENVNAQHKLIRGFNPSDLD